MEVRDLIGLAGGQDTAIYLHLQTDGMAPKEIACIAKAYEQTLRTLCVKDRDDPLTELVAKTIIKIAQTGIKDPAQISAQAISELEMR
ncbi:hypothetical protein [Bradyrhizobium sp. WSM2793]|uniref:hypothetical protein n=1 Tax=Bradyrhizobium sp. WSM2793 TaxID=1038866 RepID=UPI00036D5C0C|nr:hypothetical protein [Bradyrhizobium sp. WSM2793]